MATQLLGPVREVPYIVNIIVPIDCDALLYTSSAAHVSYALMVAGILGVKTYMVTGGANFVPVAVVLFTLASLAFLAVGLTVKNLVKNLRGVCYTDRSALQQPWRYIAGGVLLVEIVFLCGCLLFVVFKTSLTEHLTRCTLEEDGRGKAGRRRARFSECDGQEGGARSLLAPSSKRFRGPKDVSARLSQRTNSLRSFGVVTDVDRHDSILRSNSEPNTTAPLSIKKAGRYLQSWRCLSTFPTRKSSDPIPSQGDNLAETAQDENPDAAPLPPRKSVISFDLHIFKHSSNGSRLSALSVLGVKNAEHASRNMVPVGLGTLLRRVVRNEVRYSCEEVCRKSTHTDCLRVTALQVIFVVLITVINVALTTSAAAATRAASTPGSFEALSDIAWAVTSLMVLGSFHRIIDGQGRRRKPELDLARNASTDPPLGNARMTFSQFLRGDSFLSTGAAHRDPIPSPTDVSFFNSLDHDLEKCAEADMALGRIDTCDNARAAELSFASHAIPSLSRPVDRYSKTLDLAEMIHFQQRRRASSTRSKSTPELMQLRALMQRRRSSVARVPPPAFTCHPSFRSTRSQAFPEMLGPHPTPLPNTSGFPNAQFFDEEAIATDSDEEPAELDSANTAGNQLARSHLEVQPHITSRSDRTSFSLRKELLRPIQPSGNEAQDNTSSWALARDGGDTMARSISQQQPGTRGFWPWASHKGAGADTSPDMASATPRLTRWSSLSMADRRTARGEKRTDLLRSRLDSRLCVPDRSAFGSGFKGGESPSLLERDDESFHTATAWTPLATAQLPNSDAHPPLTPVAVSVSASASARSDRPSDSGFLHPMSGAYHDQSPDLRSRPTAPTSPFELAFVSSTRPSPS